MYRAGRSALDHALAVVPVIGIIRLDSAASTLDAAHALLDGGLSAIEVTLTTPGALETVTALHEERTAGVVVGAGSVRTPSDVQAAVAAGADFLVTPTTNLEVLTAAATSGIPVLCGALTPTEMDAASRAGAAFVKLFPGSLAGPPYLREVLAPLPDLRIVPTGGVTIDNLGAWFAAGAVAVAVGGALVPREGAEPAMITVGAARFAAAARIAIGAE